MAKALKVIGTIAGAVALVATGVGAFAAAGSALASAAGTVATVASIVGGVATIGASLLQKPPPARGSVANVVIQADAPSPYPMGEGLFGGFVRHDCAYGPTLNKVPNPYRFIAAVYACCGPVDSITPYVDQQPVSSWYNTYLYTSTQLGNTPEAAALSPQWSGAPGWDSSSKLSGKAAIGWSFKFDKDGKRFASGLPALAAYGRWVKIYDPRKDSTFPGGSGSHRLGIESTYEWSENPALHAGMYAYGRYQNGKRVMGVGLPKEAINWQAIAAWANVCDLNSWTMFGVVYEPGDRWQNLRDICFAGGAEPAFSGGVLSFRYSAPKVPLDTVVESDLFDENASVTAQASWRERINTVIPKYRSPAHNWELIPSNEVSVASYVTEDGEKKSEEIPFNFVKQARQAEQLAAYRIVDGRELQPITLVLGSRMFAYRPGECLHLNIPSLSLDTDAIILHRDFDPARMTVTLTLMGETSSKHAFALGKTGNAPPTPALKQTGQQRDELSSTVVIGTDGLPGAPGANGQTLYTWYAYADSADGTINFTTGSPGTRVYQGVAVNKDGATESANPADYVWSQYVGPPNFGLAAANGGEVAGSKIIRRSGGDHEAQVYSTESFVGGAYVAFKLDGVGVNGGCIIGLNTDPTSTGAANIDYGINPSHGGNILRVAESGVFTDVGTYSATDTFAIHYDGAFVRYYQNGTVIRTVLVSSGIRFFLDSTMNNVNTGVFAQITAWTAAGAIGPQGTQGIQGVPGTPGANGQSLYTWYAYADSADGVINFTNGAPGNRVYQGVAVNKTSATESATPSDYVWSRYVGPPSFGLAAAGNGEVAGAKIIKRSAPDWTPQVYSTESYIGGAYVAWKLELNGDGGYGGIAIGLNTDPTAASWETIDYAFYMETGSGFLGVIEGGTIITVGTFVPSDTFAIHYDGVNIRYYKSGVVVRTVAAFASGVRFFLDSAMSGSDGAKASILAWNAAGAVGPQGAQGPQGVQGVPGTPGANGQSLYTWYAYADTSDGIVNFTTGAPGTRVFQGVAANKTSASESTNPADYVWSPYVGPPSFGLAAANGGEVSGAKILNRSGPDWIPQAYSTESYVGGAFVSWKLELNGDNSYGGVMIGLNTDPTATGWESLDYAMYLENGSSVLAYAESGSINTIAAYSPGDTFAVHYDGANVRYYKNGAVIRTVAAAPGIRFFLDSALSGGPGAKATILAWTAAGSVGATGPQGPQGNTGNTGAQGAPAIGFVQDSDPGPGQFVSQTWYRPTSKEWYRWTGGAWARILGDLAAQDLIASSAFIADGIIINAKIGNLQVDTIKIANGAVTNTAAAQGSPGTLTAPGSANAVSLAFGCTGGLVRVDISVDGFKSASSTLTGRCQIIRDIGGVETLIGRNIEIYSFAGEYAPICYWFYDNPGAVTATYRIRFVRDSGSGVLSYTQPAIGLTEYKK